MTNKCDHGGPLGAEDPGHLPPLPRPPLIRPCLVSVCWPGFTAVEQYAEHASHIDTNLDVNREVMVCSDSRAKFSIRRGSFANACIQLRNEGSRYSDVWSKVAELRCRVWANQHLSIHVSYHHQNTPKPCFTIISVFRWNNCSLTKYPCIQQVKKTLEGTTVFCKRGIHCQRKSKWTERFLTPSSKLYRKNVSLFSVVCSQAFSLAPRYGSGGLCFEAVFCFIYKSISYLASQVSILTAKYDSIFIEWWYFNSYYHLSSEGNAFSS